MKESKKDRKRARAQKQDEDEVSVEEPVKKKRKQVLEQDKVSANIFFPFSPTQAVHARVLHPTWMSKL